MIVRALEERDLDEADRIFRLAFGTFLGLPDPMTFAGDADYIRTRWRADPPAALAAEVDGMLAGSNFLTRWGSVGFFGPLTVHPEHWGRGVTQPLLRRSMEILESWPLTVTGLYTFAQSAKHVGLYQKFGFWPRYLTAILARPTAKEAATRDVALYSALAAVAKQKALELCRSVTGRIYEGLDVEREIRAVDAQQLGDTVLVWDGPALAAFAVCHAGRGSEAGSGSCYVKFGAAREKRWFEELLAACEAYAARVGADKVRLGVNTERTEAYRTVLASGFRLLQQGVVMQRESGAGYNRPEVYLLDDWR